MYEKRIVLFLDILGFQKIIDDTEKNGIEEPQKVELLVSALKEMKKIVSLMPSETSKIITQFSDSIIVSFSENDLKEIPIFLSSIHRLVSVLAERNLLCRGAISFGNIYHTKEFVLGPALVEAYKTETEAAVYPRVIFDKSILDILKDNYLVNRRNGFKALMWDGKIDSYLKIDSDDKFYIDYFSKAAYYFEDEKLFEYYSKLRSQILKGIQYNKNRPGILAKYGWMKNKYNRMPTDFRELNKEEDLFYKRPDILRFVDKFKEI